MHNGPITQVNNVRAPVFNGPPQPILPGNGIPPKSEGRPSSTGPPTMNNFIPSRTSSGASSPALHNQPSRPMFPPPPFDRNTGTLLRPTSLPPSLNTSPSRTPISTAHSISSLNGPNPMFRPNNGVPPRMPLPPNFAIRPPNFNQIPPTSNISGHPAPSSNPAPYRPPPQPTPPMFAPAPPTSIPNANGPSLFRSNRPNPVPAEDAWHRPNPGPPPPQEPPPPPSLGQGNVARLGASGLKAKRPVPSYNINQPPSGPPSSQPLFKTGQLPSQMPPQSGQMPPQPGQIPQYPGQMPPQPGQMPPHPGQMPPQPGQIPPYPGQMPPQPGQMPLQVGQMPSQPGEMPPQPGQIPQYPGQMPPQPGQMPTQPGQMLGYPSPMVDPATARMRQMSLSDMSFINLMEHRSVFPKDENLTCIPPLPADLLTHNKYPEHFCSTLNALPSSSSMLSKLKVPFGLIIQPFKNLENEIPVVHPPIPRCKVCRTYVNPYVQLNDGARRWKCNICARLNDMPADYFYGEDGKRIPFDVSKRPELNSALVEYIAPSEYTTRPPQSAVYLYLIDVSIGAVQSGMVKMACKVLEEEIDNIPGDSRKSIGIICVSSKLHYFNLHKNSGQPQMLVVADLEEPFIPTLDELMVNIKEERQKIKNLLSLIPSIFADSKDPDLAVGPALKSAKELIFRFGGRISLLMSRAPSVGTGTIKKRGDTTKIEGLTLSPLDDFYKTLALECTQKQVTVDLFLFPNDNIDVPTVSTISQFSSGSVYYYPQYHAEKNPLMAEKFVTEFRHYVIRPIAFEAVLRIRCTSGINIHTFFGNCFVRAHDLIALANVSPDVSYGVQISIDDTLHENKLAIFQSALLFTSSYGDRRIRVHTLALPITSDPQQIYNNLNIDASISLLAKMAVEKANQASLGDAREALQYAVIDPLVKYRTDYCPQTKGSGQLVVPASQRLLPLLVSSILKSKAFRLQNVSVDDRYFSMLQFKTLPIEDIMLMVYPRLFSIHNLAESWTDKNIIPPRIALTAERLTRQGAFLLQTHELFIIWIGRHVSEIFINSVYNARTFNDLPELSVGLQHHDNAISDMIHDLISLLSKVRDAPINLISVREDSRFGSLFLQHLVEDRADGQISYYEFLQKIQKQVG